MRDVTFEEDLPNYLSTPMKRREWIHALEDSVRNASGAEEGGTNSCPVIHHFADGMYMRSGFMPAGSIVVGKIHKYETINILHSGTMTVVTEEGGAVKMVGPQIIVSGAGCKKALYIHTDCYFSNVNRNRTDTRDVAELEEELIVSDYNLIENGDVPCG